MFDNLLDNLIDYVEGFLGDDDENNTDDDFKEEEDFISDTGHGSDSDDDGFLFEESVDIDGDGIIDGVTTYEDIDGDGVADIATTYLDTDGDGMIDSATSYQDTDGDGIIDTVSVSEYLDTDDDGIMDSFVTDSYYDIDGDGTVDIHETEILSDDYHAVITEADMDNDGEADYIVVQEDLDGDGIVDNSEVIPTATDYPYDIDDITDNVGNAPAYEQFDPDNCDLDDIIGDPGAAMDSWHVQETSSSCAVASQEFILEQLTGYEFDEADLRDFAETNGWYDPDGGTSMRDVGNILEAAGLEVERSTGNSITDIENCLENGGQIIVGVDAYELWDGESNDFYLPGDGANHAIQVIGVDHSDPSEPMVIINDSGTANGGGAMVSLDVFMDAWEDSGYFMVEAYA
ncbi:MAG: C39 family peptidase [Oscillospiraceae bacterium]|nr:C39 family peptidase [Oscillospiraceae bacterium]